MYSYRKIQPISRIAVRHMCDCKLAPTLASQHLVQTKSGQKFRLESKLQYRGAAKALSTNAVDAIIQEAVTNRNFDQIPIDRDWRSDRFEVSIPEIDKKIESECAVTPHLRLNKFQLELPCVTIDRVEPWVSTAEGISWHAMYTLAYQQIDHSQAIPHMDKILARVYADQWRTEFEHITFDQAIKAIDNKPYNRVILATDSHLLIQHVSYWCNNPYYQTTTRLMDKFPFLYRLCFGLVVGGLGPGLVWAVCTQAIMLRFYFNFTDQEEDWGPTRPPLSAPGRPAFVRYWLEVVLMTGILLGIYATAIYYGFGPDPTRLIRNTIIWGASFHGLELLKE